MPTRFGDSAWGTLVGAVETAGGALAASAVQSVVIESSAFPAITLENPLGGLVTDGSGNVGPAAPPPFWLSLVRPRVTVNTTLGQFVLAPAGDPPATPWLLFAMLGVVALAAYGAATLIEGRNP